MSEPPELEGDGGAAAGAHLDAIAVDGWTAGEDAAAAQGPELEGLADGFLTREQFRSGFGLAFQLAGALVRLESLRRAPERPEADPAADVVYDIARETPWLHWLISPSSVWLQRAIVLGAFAVPLAADCAEELRARRARPVNPPPDADQAPQE